MRRYAGRRRGIGNVDTRAHLGAGAWQRANSRSADVKRVVGGNNANRCVVIRKSGRMTARVRFSDGALASASRRRSFFWALRICLANSSLGVLRRGGEKRHVYLRERSARLVASGPSRHSTQRASAFSSTLTIQCDRTIGARDGGAYVPGPVVRVVTLTASSLLPRCWRTLLLANCARARTERKQSTFFGREVRGLLCAA